MKGRPLAFVCDRPRRPVALAEGLDRSAPAVLLTVGLHLPCFAQQPTIKGNSSIFLQKLGTLARLALSAALQKREFLRRHGQTGPGFLLERARLVVAPIGLEAAVRELSGWGLQTKGPGANLAKEIVQRLQQVLEQDGRVHGLETCVDSANSFYLGEKPLAVSQWSAADIAGLTAWEPSKPPREQAASAGPAHAVVKRGTAAIVIPADKNLTPEEAAEILRYTYCQTDVVRLRFIKVDAGTRQLTAPWEETTKGRIDAPTQ